MCWRRSLEPRERGLLPPVKSCYQPWIGVSSVNSVSHINNVPHLALWFYGVLATEQFIDSNLVKPAARLSTSCKVQRTARDEGQERPSPRSPAQRVDKEMEPTRLFGGRSLRKVAHPLPQPSHVAAERAIEAQVCLRSYPIYYR